MRRFIQIFALLVLCLAVRPVQAFSLLGPLPADGGEAWQIPEVGYGLPGDVGAVKNLTEEYRWNIPIISYAFDPSFINYFGTNGMAAVEAAIAVYNSLPDLSTLSQTLDEYPLRDPATGATTTFRDSRRVNYTAQALNLLDVKTWALGILAEELGLASPERFIWSLRARGVGGTPPVTNYFVIMRNFDPVTYMPSRYVNGNRYTYNIVEFENPATVYPFEFAADPESALHEFSSVANLTENDLNPGVFYTYLTRDDIGGLRYIYDRDNLNWEPFPPNTDIIAPDFTSITLLTNIDLTSFSGFTSTNPPAVVQAAFPDLIISSSSSFLTLETQFVGMTLTNSLAPWDDPFSLELIAVPVLGTNFVVRYNYTFANVITNFAGPTSVIRTETSGLSKEPWSTPFNPIFRTNVTTRVVNLPSGSIFIRPPTISEADFITSLSGLSFTNVIGVTNVVFQTNITDTAGTRTVRITEITTFTNITFGVFPLVVQPAPGSVLRGGIGEINFQRLSGAVFNGATFLHTNTYTVSYYTNAFGIPSLVTNTFSRVQNEPDILFGAADLGLRPNQPNNRVAPLVYLRSINFVNNGALNSGLGGQGGPGTLVSPIEIVFNKVGPGLFNQRPGAATEEAAYATFVENWIWGSFDGSTNPPVVFPKDITLEDISLLINGGVAP